MKRRNVRRGFFILLFLLSAAASDAADVRIVNQGWKNRQDLAGDCYRGGLVKLRGRPRELQVYRGIKFRGWARELVIYRGSDVIDARSTLPDWIR